MALQNFLPKLKSHILSRVLSILRQRNPEPQALPSSSTNVDSNFILFKHDRIYRHNIMRVSYTTYDVRREEDVLHPSACQHNIVVLDDRVNDDAAPSGPFHPFTYGRVLGIYHVNAVYVGPGMTDYQPIRVEFIWVRWYRRVSTYDSWTAHKLDRLKFYSVEDADAFSFVDPSDVLRGCHIIPRFREGRRHTDGKGASLCARDALDWKEYYVNRSVHLQSSSKRSISDFYRFVDRDMLMRYHFGLGVGHTYLSRACNLERVSRENSGGLEGTGDATGEVELQAIQPIDGEVGNHEDIISDDEDSGSEVLDESDNEEADDTEEDDDEFQAMNEMYGF